MSGYIGNVPTPQATQTRDVFTATASQTSFATSGYTPGFLDVFLNGVKLVNGTDFTASNGSDVVLTSGAALDDNLEVVAYTTFQVVDQSFSGNFSVDTDTLFVDAANNRVGVGTASPSATLTVGSPNASAVSFVSNPVASFGGGVAFDAGSGNDVQLINYRTSNMQFGNGGSVDMTIDSSGNVGIGTATVDSLLHLQKSDLTAYSAAAADGQVGVGPTIYLENPGNANNTVGGQIVFGMRSTEEQARIGATGGSAPALTFGTADAEVVRITDGKMGIGTTTPAQKLHNTGTSRFDGILYAFNDVRVNENGQAASPTSNNTTNAGARLFANGNSHVFSAVDDQVLLINRMTNDGALITFYQAGNAEGSISVSGSTITYGGGHLARWSRLPREERADIPKGTVLTNLDAMVVWQKEDGTIEANEQLNQTEISSVEGDPNVAGVFDHWDNDDDEGYNSDFYVALTGDFIIRIGAGVTVQRGDLLMSAGDGTAKPQGDDIVRSKTIAKVTSTHVTCTYEDGSYCVPCVLMAC
jgi:hypothetical protein